MLPGRGRRLGGEQGMGAGGLASACLCTGDGPVALLILAPRTSSEGLGGCPRRAHAASALRTVPGAGRRRRARSQPLYDQSAVIPEGVTFVLG